jgi:predicted transcriptional regulator
MKIKELAGNKLSVLFFARALGIPLTNEQITEFFIKTYFLNYFDLQQILAELVESQHLAYMECRQSHYYTLADKGREALDFFQNRIDVHVQEDIIKYAHENRDRLRNESQLTANYKRLDNNEYEVALRVMEGDMILMELKVNVINVEQAKIICSNWKSKAPEVYKKVMESLI